MGSVAEFWGIDRVLCYWYFLARLLLFSPAQKIMAKELSTNNQLSDSSRVYALNNMRRDRRGFLKLAGGLSAAGGLYVVTGRGIEDPKSVEAGIFDNPFINGSFEFGAAAPFLWKRTSFNGSEQNAGYNKDLQDARSGRRSIFVDAIKVGENFPSGAWELTKKLTGVRDVSWWSKAEKVPGGYTVAPTLLVRDFDSSGNQIQVRGFYSPEPSEEWRFYQYTVTQQFPGGENSSYWTMGFTVFLYPNPNVPQGRIVRVWFDDASQKKV